MIYLTYAAQLLPPCDIVVKSGLSLLTKMPKKKKTKENERTGWESEDDKEGCMAC